MAETSCFRYWGQGIWTEYGQELCRRGRRFCPRLRPLSRKRQDTKCREPRAITERETAR